MWENIHLLDKGETEEEGDKKENQPKKQIK